MSEEPTKAVSPLRQRMIDDMRMRKLSDKTQTAYIRAVRRLARFLGRSPDTATAEDVRRFQLHLVDVGMSAISINATITALKFFPWNVRVRRVGRNSCFRCPPVNDVKSVGLVELLIEIVVKAAFFEPRRVNELQKKFLHPLPMRRLAADHTDDVALFGFVDEALRGTEAEAGRSASHQGDTPLEWLRLHCLSHLSG